MELTASKLLCRMKLIILLLTVGALQVAAKGNAQNITISVKDVALQNVFKQITDQTGYQFFYTNNQLEMSKPVTVDVKNESLESVLEKCLKDQSLTYSIINKTIVIKNKKPDVIESANDIRGKIISETGEPIPGATVTVKGTNNSTTTDASGEFILNNTSPTDILVVTGAEMQSRQIVVGNKNYLLIRVIAKINELDAAITIGYGTTTRRFTTGSIGRLTAADIAKQPVANPLAALQGRIAGLDVTSTSGVPGSSYTVQIRGQNSLNPLTAGVKPMDQPLFIIDGVPFAPQNNNINQFNSVGAPGVNATFNNPYGGFSPFSSLNPNDIESIEVLKDADATAIYGSRAANGVILITTKKGKPGATKFRADIQTGISNLTRTMKMMNTSEYIAMRKEAFSNDGLVPSSNTGTSYAPDLTVFDSTRNMNWNDYLLGNTAAYSDINFTISGGSEFTRFLIGAGYHKESFLYPGDFVNNRGTVNLNLNHSSTNRKLAINLSANYSYNKNTSPGSETLLRVGVSLPPNYPDVLDDNQSLLWTYKDVNLFENPMGYLKQVSNVQNYNLNTNLLLSYKLLKYFQLQVSAGYNTYTSIQKSQFPRISYHPALFSRSISNFGNSRYETYLVEPKIEFRRSNGIHDLTVMAGMTYQQNSNYITSLYGENYQDDALLGSISAASVKNATDAFEQYKYAGIFSRATYILLKKYIINLNARRDGSSRFGPGNQFGNFGAIGAGWIFSDENIIREYFPALSFGKIRASYGTTGSDAIGNYQYIPRWGIGNYPYQGNIVYQPQNLYNPDFKWSTTRKFDSGIDMGFINNKILLSVVFFLNRSGNQLISERLPLMTGFANVTGNFPAVVQNKGWEISLKTVNIAKADFSWTTYFNITMQRNKLISFPGLENSGYVNLYTLGQSTNQIKTYISQGVNDTTGVYQFEDVNRDGIYNTADFKVIGNRDPKFAGGLGNTVTFKGLSFDLFFEFKKQFGPNYLQQIYSYNAAGAYFNLPELFVNRWQHPGDQAMIGKLTTSQTSAAGKANLMYSNSDAAYEDASYIRLKSAALSYALPQKMIQRLKVTDCRVYVNAQNLFVITKYKGHDPETMSFFGIPPLRTFVAGVQITF